MKWLVLLTTLTACDTGSPAAPATVTARPWISLTAPCPRTPEPPGGVVSRAALEAYIADMSERLERCADKVDLLNARIRKDRGQ